MCLTAFSVISAVFVANINHQAQGDTVVPYWVHKFSCALGRLMCVKMVTWEERHCNIRQLALVSSYSLLLIIIEHLEFTGTLMNSEVSKI